jgi:hypothetical protein
VILDSKFNWNQHLQKIIRKAQTTSAAVGSTYGKKWGLRPSMVVQGHAKNHQNSIRQDSENGLPSYYRSYEIDPTAVMEVLLNLTLLDQLIMVEARVALHSLHTFKHSAVSDTEAGLFSIWKNVCDPILDMLSDHTIPVYHYSRTFKIIIDWDYWRNKDPVHPEYSLI